MKSPFLLPFKWGEGGFFMEIYTRAMKQLLIVQARLKCRVRVALN